MSAENNQSESSSRIVLIDMDGVVANFDHRLADELRKVMVISDANQPSVDRNGVEEHINRYILQRRDHQVASEVEEACRQIMTRPGFFASLEPIPCAVDEIKEMSRCSGIMVFFCSSPMSNADHCASEKMAWIGKYFGSEWTRRLIITKDKTLVRGDFLIDDHPNPSGVLKPVWKHIVFDQPYNQQSKAPLRMKDWFSWRQCLFPEEVCHYTDGKDR